MNVGAAFDARDDVVRIEAFAVFDLNQDVSSGHGGGVWLVDGFDEAELKIVERAMVAPSFEAIPIHLQSVVHVMVTKEGFEIADISETTGDFDPDFVRVLVAAGVRHCRVG